MSPYSLLPRFQNLFRGRGDAFGTGRGQWIKRSPGATDYLHHMQGEGPGLGIAPLLDDGTCWFAAIDLDEPDFAAAREMQDYIPGRSFIERSRSGNAHVWVFFSSPIPAWLPRGILREAHLTAGKKVVEIFPKQDRLLPGMLGNYINLPYYGDDRPVLVPCEDEAPGHAQCDFEYCEGGWNRLSLEVFLSEAEEDLNDPKRWEQRAKFLPNVMPPERRDQAGRYEAGQQPFLHICAEHIIANCESNPITDGHRNAVYFALAKMLTNYADFDHEDAVHVMLDVNSHALPPAPESDVLRILGNAERMGYTSTDCDNPLVQPWTHPDCPIANQSRR